LQGRFFCIPLKNILTIIHYLNFIIMLQYTLVDNLLTPAPNDFSGQPVHVRSHDLQAIFQRISARYPGLTPAQISSAVNEFIEEVCAITESGETVNTPLFTTQLSIVGVFDGAIDAFDAKRHSVRINLNAGVRLRDAARQVKTEKVAVAEPLPHILEVKDVVSDTVNETLTPSGVLQLRGSRLKFLPAEENNGVFLIGEQGVETKLAIIAENKPARIMAVLPADLPQGNYFVEIRTTFSSGNAKPARTLKTGRFHKELTV
jgi:hypothetical protein